MKKVFKIFILPIFIFLFFSISFIRVNAYSETCPIIFDGSDNYNDFRKNLDGSKFIYVLVKIKDADYDLVKKEYLDYNIYDADVYVSSYIPYMSILYNYYADFTNNYSDIENLSEKSYFEYIFISTRLTTGVNDEEIENTSDIEYKWKSVLEDVGLNFEKTRIDYDLKIGILEKNTIDKNKVCYNNEYDNTIQIILDPDAKENKETLVNNLNHATVVCSIISEITKNICNVTFYSTTSENFIKRIDWFVQNKVKIINISWGEEFGNTQNVYTKLDAIFDAYSVAEDITFIKSAGNETTDITSPGKGGNIITVGACDSLYKVYNNSAYSLITRKPTIVAPGVNLNLDFMCETMDEKFVCTGTSFACAIATGVISLLYAHNKIEQSSCINLNTVIIAGSIKLSKTSDTYCVKSGFGLINYQLSQNIIDNDNLIFYENINEFSMSDYVAPNSSIEIFLFALAKPDNIDLEKLRQDEYNGIEINYGDEETICYPRLDIQVKSLDDNSIICQSKYIDNVYNLKIINLENFNLNYYMEIIDAENLYSSFAIAIRNYGEYNLVQDNELHYWESKYDLIFDEHIFNNDEGNLICTICDYVKKTCDSHIFEYSNELMRCVNCGYNELMDNILVADPSRHYECGTQINLCEEDISVFERSYKGNNIVQGYTRLLYFDSENIPSKSRLDYNWVSSDENIANVSEYGTVTALNVTESTNVIITATYKFDSSIKFYKMLLIEPDRSNCIKTINYTISMKYDEIYKFRMPLNDVPTSSVLNYNWNVPCQKEEYAGVKISNWGTITAVAPGTMYINGFYKYNSNIIVVIKVIVNEDKQ